MTFLNFGLLERSYDSRAIEVSRNLVVGKFMRNIAILTSKLFLLR